MADYLNFPYDPELFLYQWQNEKDPTKTAMLNSGAMQANGTIKNLIANGSDYYTIPFYALIGGDPVNYDGATNIGVNEVSGKSQHGIVFGRANSWKDRDFIRDFNSGADPMKQITSQVAKYWQKQRQTTMLAILRGIFNIADDTTDAWDEWQLHSTHIARTDAGAVGDSNKVGETTGGDAIQKAVGDASDQFTLAIMHSKIATNLANKQLLNFWKQTDSQGIERKLRIADWNGMTVVIDDGVPVTLNEVSNALEYTTYLMGIGALQYAPAPVDTPVEIGRNQLENGGYNFLTTRLRETIHPNGFSFVIPDADYTKSPTNNQLGANAAGTSNWTIAGNPKNIAIARIVSNG